MNPMQPLSPSRATFEQERRVPLLTTRPVPVAQLGTAAMVIAQAQADADYRLRELFVANITTASVNYTLHVVPSGATPTPANAVAFQVQMTGNTTTRLTALCGEQGLLLAPGDALWGLADAAASINIGGWGEDMRGGA